ncbi:glycerol-3-phosphate dehydrogenase [Oleiagrimonas sp.]|uniref:glycerol-3-phosphate dehydrogenase n=1 Tax=Oleiagrimonas sp. TaxID=2010330 RepID=UPI00260C5680|nr:glycerol-3-phosphate dehydrogenase [Oleiagrimonas sp.]MDA3915276.1 glycerol-3-phosphate dehydrogenase [Oleiagrimonas sp.]
MDVLVVGGGVNGAGIARDAVGRGLTVVLCEQDDLAAHTSSSSTKLIHGGLRYLEQYEFRLVAKALAEREVILRLAPHITWPLLFVLPHESHLRPVWMIRLGLLLYDHLGPSHRTLADSRAVKLSSHVSGEPLKSSYKRGFVYSDGWVQDARLVVLNAMDAAQRGAHVYVHTRCESAQADNGAWVARLVDADGSTRTVRARSLVNATGPWAGRFLGQALKRKTHAKVRLVKGSHIVVPRMFEHDHAYIFQQPDQRIVFAIPYETRFTLIGTTDVEYDGDPANVEIEQSEIEYLCKAVNRYFKRQLAAQDVVWSYSGVRPLQASADDDATSASRDYRLALDHSAGAPILNVLGGKITTYRRLAEQSVDLLSEALSMDLPSWTEDGAVLPGGDFADAERLLASWSKRWPWLPVSLAHRWLRHYGTRVDVLLEGIENIEGLGIHFGNDVYQAEVDYLIRHEWARSSEDILWRRTKMGLHLDAKAKDKLKDYLAGDGPPDQTASSRDAHEVSA